MLYISTICIVGACKSSTSNAVITTTPTTTDTYTGTGSVSKGLATTTVANLFTCTGGRATALGTSTSTDNKTWIVPAENNFATGAKLPDLFNECNGKSPASITQVDLTSIPTTIIDADGEIITGYIYGDNYYELYVNGKLVGVDATTYTPFNSSYVKFKAKRPLKYAIKLVDWEENLGIGSELSGTDAFHAGDGGFVAAFSDGTNTSSAWKAQTYYIAPLVSPNCVVETGTARVSTFCTTPTSAASSYALHWAVPATWYESGFDFSSWQPATVYTAATVGVKPAYSNFTTQFGTAQFIWSSNLVLDNLVLLRFTGN